MSNMENNMEWCFGCLRDVPNKDYGGLGFCNTCEDEHKQQFITGVVKKKKLVKPNVLDEEPRPKLSGHPERANQIFKFDHEDTIKGMFNHYDSVQTGRKEGIRKVLNTLETILEDNHPNDAVRKIRMYIEVLKV